MSPTHSPPGEDEPFAKEDALRDPLRVPSNLSGSSLLGERLLRVPEVAELLGISDRSLRRYAAQGILCPVRFGRQVRFRESDLAALLFPAD